MKRVFHWLLLLLLSLALGFAGYRLAAEYTHYQQDHQFIHWLAVEIEKQQKAPKP